MLKILGLVCAQICSFLLYSRHLSFQMMASTSMDPLLGFIGLVIDGATLVLMAADAPTGLSLNSLLAYYEHLSTCILNWTVILEAFLWTSNMTPASLGLPLKPYPRASDNHRRALIIHLLVALHCLRVKLC